METLRYFFGLNMSEKIREYYLFEEFRLDAENPGLWRNGELVSISPKALELLILLVENHGEIVSNDELMDSVWKDTFVETGNISYTVSLLRKALGNKQLIKSIPRRGYRFSGEVRKIAENVEETAELITRSPLAQISSRRTLLAISVAAMVLLTSFALFWRNEASKIPRTQRNIKSIAILPFRNLNDNAQNDPLSLGLTNALISSFGRLNHLRVRPFDLVQDFLKSGKESLKFGEELKADSVLEGTFQSDGGRIRITIRLIDVRDGAQIWSENFDESESDIFVLQDKIAVEAARSLILDLNSDERRILSKHYTENPEAFRAYTRGRAILDSRKRESADKAESEFRNAVALDPTFALAYTGLAETFAFRGLFTTGEKGAEYYKIAKQFAFRSLELDGELAEGYVVLGRVKRNHDFDGSGAETDFRRAIELNPNIADAYLYYAHLLATQGRIDEADAELAKAREIDPISQRIFTAQFPFAEVRGDFEKGFDLARDYYETNRENPIAKRSLATFLLHRGEYQKVIEFAEPILEKGENQDYVWLSLLTAAHHKTGNIQRTDQLLGMLEERSKKDTKALFSLAMNYAELGNIDGAIKAIETCFQAREERTVWIKVEPRLANIRNDPRYQILLEKMGFG